MHLSCFSHARKSRSLPGLLASLSLASLLIPQTSLASGVVTNCTDAGLRAALAGGGTVTFDCDGTIVLTNTLTIAANTVIDGTGHSVTVSGGAATRLLLIKPGVTLTLSRLALVDGVARGTNGGAGQSGEPAQGGAICNSNGVLNAFGCTFAGHLAQGGNGGANAFIPGSTAGNGGEAAGGAIYNWLGSVNASNCLFLSNRAVGGAGGVSSLSPNGGSGGESRGGALCNVSGSVHIVRTELSNNVALAGQHRRFSGIGGSAAAYGGAVCNLGDAALVASRMSGNMAISEYTNSANGGAIWHRASKLLSLTDCTISENRALAGGGFPLGLARIPGGPALGGGLHVATGEARLTNTTLANNFAVGGAAFFSSAVPCGPGTGRGGGVYSDTGSAVHLVNCTVARNVARGGQGQLPPTPMPSGDGEGGGFYNTSAGSVFLTHVTVAANAAEPGLEGDPPGQGRGGAIASAGGSVRLRNTIIAPSLSASNCFGSGIVDGGHNISSDESFNFSAPGSLNSTDPALGPLTDYGGLTLTMALLAGSPALDAADPAFCPATDQRGRARPFGAGCDIGAVESAPPYTLLGHVHGFTTPASGIQVASPANSTNVPPSGQFALHGFTLGTHLLSIASPECVFVPRTRSVTVGPDVVDVSFLSYRSNALVIERISAGVVRWVFAGEGDATYHVLSGTNVALLTPSSTNQAQPNGLIEMTEGPGGAPVRFFQVVRP